MEIKASFTEGLIDQPTPSSSSNSSKSTAMREVANLKQQQPENGCVSGVCNLRDDLPPLF